MSARNQWGTLPEMIEALLKELGPMTVAELIAAGVPGASHTVRKTAGYMAQPSKRRKPVGERRIHITAWTYDAEGERPYPRPVYALGHGENKPKPATSVTSRVARNAIARKYQAARRKRLRGNFIFNLGGVRL